MDAAPSATKSFVETLGFFGDVIFNWVPSVVLTVIESVNSPITSTEAETGRTIAEPLAASEFARFLERSATPGAYDAVVSGWHTFTILSFAISLPFIAVTIYCMIRVFLLRRHEARELATYQQPVAAEDMPKTQLRWHRVLEQAGSDNEHAWRLAILEADIMLNDLLDIRGYKGETMADKMKQVNRGDFHTIDAAWEAHRVRNRIAHDGSAHPLNPREVRRVIELYESVFKEFGYIQ